MKIETECPFYLCAGVWYNQTNRKIDRLLSANKTQTSMYFPVNLIWLVLPPFTEDKIQHCSLLTFNYVVTSGDLFFWKAHKYWERKPWGHGSHCLSRPETNSAVVWTFCGPQTAFLSAGGAMYALLTMALVDPTALALVQSAGLGWAGPVDGLDLWWQLWKKMYKSP